MSSSYCFRRGIYSRVKSTFAVPKDYIASHSLVPNNIFQNNVSYALCVCVCVCVCFCLKRSVMEKKADEVG